MRSTYDLPIRCKAHEEARNMLTEILDSASQQINALFEDLSLDDRNVLDDLVVDEDNDQIEEMQKAPKRKGQSSQEIIHAQNSHEANYVLPPKYPTGYPFLLPSFVSQFGPNQQHWQYPILEVELRHLRSTIDEEHHQQVLTTKEVPIAFENKPGLTSTVVENEYAPNSMTSFNLNEDITSSVNE
ncbi:hypothetical protein Pfo_006891, partial [Paulownia fortunei]